MNEVLIDTDILSLYFRGDSSVVKNLKNYMNSYEQLNISIITHFEILRGLKYKNATAQIAEFELFSSTNNLIHLTEQSSRIAAEIYADLRKAGISIGNSDLLISGIAVENELTLVTNNEKHFAPIKNLKIVNWRK